MSIKIHATWKAIGINGHSEPIGNEFVYTSNDAPVEADEYERVVQQLHDLRAQLAAATAERDALLARVERFGADQWRRGNAGKEPQEFDEWRKEQ